MADGEWMRMHIRVIQTGIPPPPSKLSGDTEPDRQTQKTRRVGSIQSKSGRWFWFAFLNGCCCGPDKLCTALAEDSKAVLVAD